MTHLASTPVRLKGADPQPIYVTGTSSQESAPKSFVRFLADDADRSLMPFYADLTQWPANFPFPSMPYLSSVASTDGLRFTQFRGVARCSPRRMADQTGTLCHITAEHPYGNGVGDVPGQTPSGQVPFFKGLQPHHRPWAKVLKESGAPHATITGPKYHLFERTAEGDDNVVNRRAPVEIAGFDHAVQSSLSGSGEPNYGYFNFKWWETYSDSGMDSSGVNNPMFNPTWVYERMVAWIEEQLSGPDPKPIVVNYWTHLPHGNPPAFDQFVGPNGEQVHTTYTYDQHIPNTISADGKVALGDPRAGYDANGVFWDEGAGDDIADFPYTSEGAVHVFWRRTVSLYEALDYFAKKLHDYIRDNFPETYANTLFMADSDNGSDPGVLVPIETTEFAGLGAEYANTFPPTSDGTVTGDLFHSPDDAKGSSKDQGILSHLLVWGPQLPAARQGTDCHAMIDATDFYPTILDYLAPGAWQDALGADLNKLDGTSFLPRIMDGQLGGKIYTYHRVQKPGWVEDETWFVHQFDTCIVKGTATERWKLRRIFEREYDNGGSGGANIIPKTWQLFDLLNDPTELVDLRPNYGDVGFEHVTAAIDELTPLYIAKFGVN